jgi:serine/threonine protein kinase
MTDGRISPTDPPDDTPTVFAPPSNSPASDDPTSPSTNWANGQPPDLPARLGRYELLKLLGKGGMGAVYLAHDDQLHRLVAVKIPHFGGPNQFNLRDRFLREARVAATLSHPNLCPVHDCGEIDSVLYLSMAYLEGRPLSKFIRSGQPLPPRAVVAVVRQLALAMQEAHTKGVIHRDLKPANIMITPRKQPVIMDFGLARRTDIEDLHLTQSGMLMGTPAYMPPEQLNSDTKAMGPGTDIYALGVILYELLSGKPPFQGPLGELMTRIMTETPPPLVRSRADLPPALDAICAKALAKKPADRFASMAEFAAALGDYLHGRYRLPEPEVETYEVVEDDHRPLEEQDPAVLFRAMAARQKSAKSEESGVIRIEKRARPSTPHTTLPAPQSRASRRRSRVKMPEWLVPLVVSAFALGVMSFALWWFVHFLDKRSQRPDSALAGTLDPAQVAEEQRRLAEQKMLERLVAQLAVRPTDLALRQEMDAWLDSPAGKRMDLSSDVNLGLAQYLILNRDRWDAALKRLTLTGNSPWRAAAEADLAAAAGDVPAVVKAGDDWWQLAETMPAAARSHLHARAGKWYTQALPHLQGAEADRVRRRVEPIMGPRRPA